MSTPERTKDETKPWRWEEDGFTVTRGSAWSGPGCHDGCGVLLYTKDGKLVKVEGDPKNPFNQGRLCVRCLALPDVTNHPDRLQYPMKRVGERGEDKWERISWDEALDTIEKNFNKIKKDFGPEFGDLCPGHRARYYVLYQQAGLFFWQPKPCLHWIERKRLLPAARSHDAGNNR